MTKILKLSNKKKLFSNKKTKKLFLFVLIFIVLVAVGGGIWWYLDSQKKSVPKEEFRVSQNSNEVTSAIVTGDYTGAQKILDNNLTLTEDVSVKAYIYIQKSSASLNGGDYNGAFEFAKKSEDLETSVMSAQMMAASQEGLGNIDEAIKYYELAIERFELAAGPEIIEESSDLAAIKQDLSNARLKK